jgi:hypothetical protein
MDWFHEIAQSVFLHVRAALADDYKLAERAIEGLGLVLLFILVAKLRKPGAVREDGWFYLSPGLLSKFVFFAPLLLSLTTFFGLLIVLRAGYRPSWTLQGMMEFSPVILVMAGFGIMAAVAYRAFFKTKIRWNHIHLEKIVSREKVQIAWKDIQEVSEKKDHFLIVSGSKRIRIWSHMNGVPQLVQALGGQEKALGTLQRQTPLTTSWKGGLPSDQIKAPH